MNLKRNFGNDRRMGGQCVADHYPRTRAYIHLLPQLCANLIVSDAVMREILSAPESDPAHKWITGNQQYVVSPNKIDPRVAAWDLGAGESEVLSLALERQDIEVIIDDRAARNCASALGLPLRGTLGVILLAKSRNLIPSCKPVFEKLTSSGLRISQAALVKALDLASEL